VNSDDTSFVQKQQKDALRDMAERLSACCRTLKQLAEQVARLRQRLEQVEQTAAASTPRIGSS
jgi:uncharacterized coiled-coil protein SlyX